MYYFTILNNLHFVKNCIVFAILKSPVVFAVWLGLTLEFLSYKILENFIRNEFRISRRQADFCELTFFVMAGQKVYQTSMVVYIIHATFIFCFASSNNFYCKILFTLSSCQFAEQFHKLAVIVTVIVTPTPTLQSVKKN